MFYLHFCTTLKQLLTRRNKKAKNNIFCPWFVYNFIPELFTLQKPRWRVVSFPVILSGANSQFFCRKLSKIAENCDQNIGPWVCDPNWVVG
jgi:hypothetical protein